MLTRKVTAGAFSLGGGEPLALVAGPCVLEDVGLMVEVAAELQRVAARRLASKPTGAVITACVALVGTRASEQTCSMTVVPTAIGSMTPARVTKPTVPSGISTNSYG